MIEIVDAYLSELSSLKLKLGHKQEAISLINEAIELRRLNNERLGRSEDHILTLY